MGGGGGSGGGWWRVLEVLEGGGGARGRWRVMVGSGGYRQDKKGREERERGS